MILLTTAMAAPGSLFTPVTTDLGGGATLNWTEVRLEMEATSARTGSEGGSALEELARRSVDLNIAGAALRIPLDPQRTLGELRQVPELWPSIEPRIGRWVETENKYFSSGRVGVVGALSLVELLKPVTMATASAEQGEGHEHTGVMIDVRGLGAEVAVTPCFAPVIRSEGGVIYEGRLRLDAAVERAPAVWVSDAAAPQTARAGERAFLVRAQTAAGCTITVPAEAVATLTAMVAGGVLAEGTLVVVVDP